MTFTATIEKEIKVECVSEDEEELDESDLEKLDVQVDIQKAYEKLYRNSEKYEKLNRLAMKKMSNFEIEKENLSTKIDEGNQTIGALKFENNFLTEKAKKLDVELFQVLAQLERT